MKMPSFVALWLLAGFLTACGQGKQDKNHNPIIADTTYIAKRNTGGDHFLPIEPINLTKAVQNAIVTHYPTARINKAYVNHAGQYKLEVVLKDGRSGYLYVDKDGNWIER